MYTIIENEESFDIIDEEGEFVSSHETREEANDTIKNLINRAEYYNNLL